MDRETDDIWLRIRFYLNCYLIPVHSNWIPRHLTTRTNNIDKETDDILLLWKTFLLEILSESRTFQLNSTTLTTRTNYIDRKTDDILLGIPFNLKYSLNPVHPNWISQHLTTRTNYVDRETDDILLGILFYLKYYLNPVHSNCILPTSGRIEIWN